MTEPSRPLLDGSAVPQLLRDLLQEGQAVCLPLMGHSMTPFIRRGDVVTITPCPGGRPRLGDVVAFAAGAERVVVHRVVGRSRGRLLLRGDAAPSADRPVTRGEVLGLVTRVERNERQVRFGLGPERAVVAWLSRVGLLRGLARLRARLRSRSPGGTPPSATG